MGDTVMPEEKGEGYLLGQLEADVRHLRTGQERLERDMKSGFASLQETVGERVADHSERIGVLEGWKQWVTGGLVVLGLVYAALVAWLFNWSGPK